MKRGWQLILFGCVFIGILEGISWMSPCPYISAIVVQGAPGDGNKSLKRALTKNLASHGIEISTENYNSRACNIYGGVIYESKDDYTQRITIRWKIIDSSGNVLPENIIQDKTFVKGALDSAWGKEADAVAYAVAISIIELINDQWACR